MSKTIPPTVLPPVPRSIQEHINTLRDETTLEQLHRLRNQVERLTVFVMTQQATIDEMTRQLTQRLRDADLEAVKRGEKPGFDNIVLWKKQS